MKIKFSFIILIVVLFLLPFCSKSTNPEETKKALEAVPKKIIKKRSNKLILEINEDKYYENEFRKFLNLHSKGFSELKNRDTIFSYIFKKFIIQRMLLYKAKIDKFEFNQEVLASNIQSLLNSTLPDHKTELLNSEKVKSYLSDTLYSRIKVKDKDIRKYYMDNKDKYRKNAQAHLFEIMLKDKNKANEIRAILNTEPMKFSEIAQKESKSQIAKENGSLGFVEIDTFPETFRKFIKAAPLNKVTPVVELLYGEINGQKVYTYHIFKVTKRKRKRLLFLSKVRESIKKELILQNKEKNYQEFIKDLSNSLKIKILTKNLFFKYKKI